MQAIQLLEPPAAQKPDGMGMVRRPPENDAGKKEEFTKPDLQPVKE